MKTYHEIYQKKRSLKWPLLAVLLAIWATGLVGLGMKVYSDPPQTQNQPPTNGATVPPGTTVPSTVPPRRTASTSEVVASVFTVLGGLSVILTLYFNIWQSIDTQYQAVIENTFSLIQSWDDSSLLEARKFTRELGDRKDKLANEDLVNEVNTRPELRHSVVQVFNFVEVVAYSIRTGRIDANHFKRSLGSTLVSIHERFKPWIAYMNGKYPGYAADLDENFKLLNDD